MKWKMSNITPNIVKSTILRSGFRLIDGTVLRAILTYRSHPLFVFQPMVSVSPPGHNTFRSSYVQKEAIGLARGRGT